ncbi:hypothetical protein T552_02253 [Pneumocystis carinii B80]|uniref:PROP1-like PPR domain-containing protein n=1 Tax=Pneumocystis carinii (strain B80) TaxID=1408658 RepID=A0A0W4ZFY5_PNEC8|nr:hypothetical protein T552_02253 [Pneumocystis carinii B80]KTW27270.1 hypothetical protein T552_02253 [Pneumocystis carinii B80]
MFGGKFVRKAVLERRISGENRIACFFSTRNLKTRFFKPGLLSIQTLEKCIARLRTRLENEEKRRRSDEGFCRKSTENEHELLYKFICKPEPQLPIAIGENTLSPVLVERIKIVPGETVSSLNWREKLRVISCNGGFEGLTTLQVNRMIYSIPSKERSFLAEDIFDMMKKASIYPDRLTYDFIMDGYAQVGDVKGAVKIFSQMKEYGFAPSVYSYAHLMKAYSKIGDIDNVLLLFKDMEKYPISPNLVIYTTLISLCVKNQLFEEAWKVFDLLKYRSKDVFPDVKTYSLMIHTCALTGEAERASELFREMLSHSEGSLTPTLETYNALISAYASRKDYFYETWRIAKTLLDNNTSMDKKTFIALLKGCGKMGDLKKARVLVKHIFQKTESLEKVDIYTFQGLFRAYANYIPEKRIRNSANNYSDNKIEDILSLKLDTNIENDTRNTFFEDISKSVFLKTDLQTSKDVLDESTALIKYIQKNKYPFLDVQLMNSYLSVLINHGSYSVFKNVYENMYYSIATKEQEKDSDLYLNKFKRGLYTYQLGLEAAYKFNDINFAHSVWNERNHWIFLMKNQEKDPEEMNLKFNRLHLTELDFNLCRLMINNLAKNNLLEEAQYFLISYQNMFSWKANHLKLLWNKAKQMKNESLMSLILRTTKLR